jgi:pyrroloquinoline quinone (PQQ) biosynthesis protein C
MVLFFYIMEELSKLYYDPKVGLISAEKLYQKVKHYGFSLKDVKEFLKKQELAQIHHRRVKDVKKNIPIIDYNEGGYQADLMT